MLFFFQVIGGFEWASFTDIMVKEIHHSQTWILNGYLPFASVAYHLLFATNNYSKVQFPSQFGENTTKHSKSKNLISILIGDMTSLTRAFAPTTALVYDLLPYLMYIIQPSLRPVNTQLYSAREKEELFHLIDTMIGYNLTYTQDRSLEGQYSFNLDPNIEEIVRFSGVVQPKQLSYATRQLVAREIELEKVRRAENYFAAQEKEIKNKNNSKSTKSGAEKKSLPNHLQKLNPKLPVDSKANNSLSEKKAAEATATVARDFFGRVIECSENKEKHSKY